MNANINHLSRLDLPSWRFKPARLGCLDANAGEIEIRPLTLVCGPNNTGKTWVMYALYGFLTSPGIYKLPELDKLAEDLVREGQLSWDFGAWLKENAKNISRSIHQAMKRRLPAIFNSPPEIFKESRFDWEIDHDDLIRVGLERAMDFRLALGREKNEVLRIAKPASENIVQLTLLSRQLPDISMILSDSIARHLIGLPSRKSVFLMPAERNGLHLFYRELASRRTALLHHASKKDKDIDIVQLIQDVARSRYAEPIAHYIDWLNDLPDMRKRKAGVFRGMAEEVKKLVGGRYEVDAEGEISFTPRKLQRGNGEAPPKMDLHLTSSTVKSLFGLWAYLEYEAQPGDVLMIDEPELNLHPSNQRKLARLLAQLANSDLRVVISTHSDYLVREMNSLIMLSAPHEKREALMQRFQYGDEQVLKPENVAAWLFGERCISEMEIDVAEGIDAETFDQQIHELNETSDDIYYAYRDGAGEADE